MTDYNDYMEIGLYREETGIECVLDVIEDDDFDGPDGQDVDVYQPFGRAVNSYVHAGTSVIEIDTAQKQEGTSSLLSYTEGTNEPAVQIPISLTDDYARLEFYVRAAQANTYLEVALQNAGNQSLVQVRLHDSADPNKLEFYYGNGAGGANIVTSDTVVDTWYKIWMDVKPSNNTCRMYVDEVLKEGPNADGEGFDNYYKDRVGPITQIKIYTRMLGDGAKSAWVDMMTNYDDVGTLTVAAPVAQNCHTLLRNKPSGDDVYTLGVEWLRNTTDSTWNAPDITGIVGKIITIGGGHGSDTFNIGYYAAGSGVAAADRGVQDGDRVRAEHPDNILAAYNCKGHVNPLEAGMVFDNAMGRHWNVAIPLGGAEATLLEYDTSDASSTGNWSFSGKRPFYVTCVRIEIKETNMDTGKGLLIHVYEDGTEVAEQAGVDGIIINDTDNWLLSEFVDGKETWYSANIYLGMMLCSNLEVTAETYLGNGAVSDVHIFAMGWYVPDTDIETGVTESFTYHAVPAPCGLYTEKIYTVDSRISINPRYLPTMDASLRTVPHARNEYRYGIEYVKNLTTDEFITSSIKEVSDTNIYFDPTAATDGDIVELGHYSYDTQSPTAGPTPTVGSTARSTNVDGLVRALNRMDRIDFGKTDFSYGDTEHEYMWYRQFAQLDFGWSYFGPSSELKNVWTTVLSFDPYNYNARLVDVFNKGIRSDYLDRGTSNIDETPFFVTGMHFACDETAISGGNKYANGVKFRITFHSGTDSVRQRNQSEIIYYPVASTADIGLGEYVPAAMGSSSINPSHGAGPFFYIPFGILRCYSFRIDAAVEGGGEAFESIHLKQLYLDGWMIED